MRALTKPLSCLFTPLRRHLTYQESTLHFEKHLCFDSQGRYLLFENRNAEEQRKFFVPLVGALLGVGCWCFHRVYHYKDRYKAAIPFYLLAGTFAFSRIRVGVFQYQQWINRIWLQQDGRQVVILTRKYILWPQEQVVDINRISRLPEEEQLGRLNSHFFKVKVGPAQELFIPRDGIIHDKEVLPAVLNGMSVSYLEQEGTVTVE